MTIWNRLNRGVFTVAACVLILMTGIAVAAFTGDIEGTVRDQSGAAVADAKVSIRNLATGATRVVTTDSTGAFAALQLDTGTYEVRVEKTGFRVLTNRAEVRSGEKTRVDSGLTIGTPQEIVTVEGGVAPILDVASAQISQSLDSQAVVSLPNQGRDPLAFATLSPGIVPVSKDNPFLGTGSFNSNGSRGRGNNITIDGVTNTDISTTGGAGLGTISLDGVQEFKLISNNFNAEFGRNSGSQLQLLTKSGSNQFHGSAYWFHQNGYFNARDYFDTTGDPTPRKYNQYGATAGGPIFKNHTFFFGHYEGLKIRGLGSTRTANVLTPDQAAAITDPTSKALFQAVGAPTSASGKLVNAAPNVTNAYSWSVRIDQVFRNGNDNFTARYGVNPNSSASPGLTFINTNLTNYGASSTNTPRTVTVGETHTFNSQVVNQFSFAFGRSLPNFPINTTLSTPFTPLLAIGPNVVDNMGIASILGQGRVQNVFQWHDSVSYVRGRHALKFGGDIAYYQANSFFDSNFRGTVTFPSIAAFQAGTPSSFTESFGNSSRHNRSKDFSWFAQDDYRVTPSLTLNLGLRVERSGGVNETNDILSNIDTSKQGAIGGAGTGPLGSVDLGGMAFGSNTNFGPRLGFAYNPGRGKLVIRGGYGVAYDYIFLNPITNLRFSPPFVPSISLVTSQITGANAYSALLGGNALAQQQAVATIGQFNPTFVNFGAFSPVQQDLANPRTQQWNLGVEYEVLKNTVAKVSWVGSHSDDLQASVPINLITASARPAPATSQADEIARLTQFNTAFAGLSGSATRPAASRLDPRFNGVTQVQGAAVSDYNSLQVEMSHTMSHGLAFTANYTWSHSIDDASDVLGVLVNDTAGLADPRNIESNRANSEFDVRHRFVGVINYELPFLRSQQGFVGHVLGGWSISTATDLHSGLPVTILAGTRRGINDNVLFGGSTGVTRANGDVSAIHPGAGAPFDPTPKIANPVCIRGVVTGGNTTSCPNTVGFALTQPLLGNFGDSGRNVLRLDDLFNTDFAVAKNTAITERVKMQFRWEFFNLFNHPNMSGYINTLSSNTFNTYTSTATNTRQMQASLKFTF